MSAIAAAHAHRKWWSTYLACGGLALVLYYLVPPFKGNGVVVNVIGLSSAIAILIGVRINNPAAKWAWYLFACGQLFFVAGDAFYYGYNAVFHQDVPFPSLGDVFYLAVYPLLIAGLLLLLHRRNPSGDRPSLIDALIITIGLALLSWVFLMAPYAHDPSLTLLEKVVSIAYPLMDVCVLYVAIRLSFGGGGRRTSMSLLVLSIVCLLTADSILGLLTLQGGYNEGGLLDAGWAFYYLLWGAAALHPSMRGLDEPAPNRLIRLNWKRLALLMGASLTAPAVQAIQAMRGAPTELPVVIASSAALFVLVVARMAGLLRETERSAARERALREAARALVAASGREEIYEAALTSMLALAGPRHSARISVLTQFGELRVRSMNSGGRGDEWLIRAADMVTLDARSLRESRYLEVELTDSPLSEMLRFSEDTISMVVYPLFVSHELRGLLFVGGERPLSPPVRDSLQMLAVKVALALESAVLTEDLHHRRSEDRFKSLVQHSSDLITVMEADSTIKYQSPSVKRVLGYETKELLGIKLSEIIHPDDLERVLSVIIDRTDAGALEGEIVEARLRHAGGEWLYFEILHTNLLNDPNVAGIVLNARDISERKAFEQQLTHQAFHDPVTSLANRALFTDRVAHALARQTREENGLSVLFIDLDEFKVINDSFGHAAGDEVLREVGLRLLGCVRPMDTVARFGGDEFAVLLEDAQRLEDAADIAGRILDALQQPMRVEDKEVYIRASMGITMLEGEDAMTSGADDLMRNADLAMYMAKREGKGHYRVFEPQMHKSVVERLELKGALRKAIERGELRLHFQPVVALPGGESCGLEALVRWLHPERGMIPPGEFIPLAEETGLIVPLGRWVLLEACKQARFFQDMTSGETPLGMSVNLSVKQLQQPDFADTVAEILSETGLDPATLILEITESVLMTDTDVTIERLNELKALGIRLAVDDFGTGYSSLSYLSKFPVDILKIDRSFVNRLETGIEEAALASAIVKLGEALNLQTVAEGIELETQMEHLTMLGCSLGQGFYFAKPMDTDATLEFLRPVSTPEDSKPRAD